MILRIAFAALAASSLLACSGSDSGVGPAPTGTTSGGETDRFEAARQLCVTKANSFRATVGVGALARWSSAEACSDGEAKSDSESGKAHGAFGKCGEFAQNECPGWSASD